MSNISSIASAASTAAVSQVTIISLQAQLARYTPAANAEGAPASTDYKALQSAINSGDLAAGQAALDRLQRDNRSGKSNGTASAAPGVGSTPDGDGHLDASV
jgi:hypothetical protein